MNDLYGQSNDFKESKKGGNKKGGGIDPPPVILSNKMFKPSFLICPSAFGKRAAG
jgi:hypothetical protein